MIIYEPKEFQEDILSLSALIRTNMQVGLSGEIKKIYGIPRGGVPVAVALSAALHIPLTSDPEEPGTLIVDDLIDSGATFKRFPGKPFACLHVKPHSPRPDFYAKEIPNKWIVYFWEEVEQPIESQLVRCLEYIGEDPTREGLQETPARIIKSWGELFGGYKKNPQDLFKTFQADGADQIVLLKDIELYSSCEHHMLPFYGKAHVAYIPDGLVLGVSKLARLVDLYARRMQIQERIGEQVTSALMEFLKPKGAACVIEADHMCMRMRGCSKQHSTMVTSSLKGIFIEDSSKGLAARAELMGLIR